MTNARITDPDNPGLQALAGTERVNGVEFGAQGHITGQLGIDRRLYLSGAACGRVDRGRRARADSECGA